MGRPQGTPISLKLYVKLFARRDICIFFLGREHAFYQTLKRIHDSKHLKNHNKFVLHFFHYSRKALFLEMWVMLVYYWDHARAQHFHFSVCIEFDCPCEGLVQNVSYSTCSWKLLGNYSVLISMILLDVYVGRNLEGSLLKVTKHSTCRQSAIPDPTREEGLTWCWD